uniref:Uncharacterized protein n=1 Tax=Pseudomonas phage Cygsa01 TaxID=3138529 RepID=A0AAU6W3K7_9VIRU
MSVHQLNLEVPTATTAHNADGARRGVFKVSLQMLDVENAHLIKGLFNDMIVVHTETSAFEGVTRYYALHDAFEPVKEGGRTPEYVVVVDRTEEEPKFYFERVTQESMI